MVAATAPKLVSLWFVPLVVVLLVVLVVVLVLLVVLVVPLLVVLVVFVLQRPSAYTFATVPSTASLELPTLFTQQFDASHTRTDKLNVESLATPYTSRGKRTESRGKKYHTHA